MLASLSRSIILRIRWRIASALTLLSLYLRTRALHAGFWIDEALAVIGACLLLTRVLPAVWAVLFGAGAKRLGQFGRRRLGQTDIWIGFHDAGL